MKDIESVHSFVACDDVTGGVAFRVADVQALAAGIREHIENIILGPGLVAIYGCEGLIGQPILLPLFLYSVKIVGAFGCHFWTSYYGRNHIYPLAWGQPVSVQLRHFFDCPSLT